MKTGLIGIALLGMLTLSAGTTYAQEYTQVPVEHTKDKLRGFDGRVYWSHSVKEKQTLYSIAKVYEVTVDEIYAANPGLKQTGLRVNTIILIPTESQGFRKEEEESPQQTQEVAKEEKKVETTVAKTESPAKSSTKEPSASSQRRSNRGETGASKAKTEKTKPVALPGETTHVVKWFEDLDQIARKHDIPVEYLMDYNGLTSKKVKSRTTLRIPPKDSVPESYLQNETTLLAEAPVDEKVETVEGSEAEETEATPEQEDEDGIFGWFNRPGKEVKAALALPLGSSTSPSNNNMDFYCGALLALRDLGNDGINVDFSVFNTTNNSPALSQESLEDIDIVIGPITKDALEKTLSLAGRRTAIVSPLDQKAGVLLDEHPNFIQAPSSYESQYSDLVAWMKEESTPQDKIIVLSQSGASPIAQSALVDSLVRGSGVPYEYFAFSIVQGRSILGSLQEKMTQEGVNRIIVKSDNEAFMFEVVRNLNLVVHNRYEVVLYAPSRIRTYSTIDVENLHNLKLHVSTSYFIDYDDPRVEKFLLAYRALYNVEPSQFAFQGYDTVNFFVRGIRTEGRKWMDRLTTNPSEGMLQSDFKMTRVEGGGLENEGIRRVVYMEDYGVQLQRKTL